MSINIRPITSADAEICGQIIYKAFCGIADQHNFPHDFSSTEHTQQFAQMLTGSPGGFRGSGRKRWEDYRLEFFVGAR